MKEELYDDIFEDKEEQIDFKASLFKYIIRWPWCIRHCLYGMCMDLPETKHPCLQHQCIYPYQG